MGRNNGRTTGRNNGRTTEMNLADAAGAAIDVIQVDSLDGVHNDSLGLHGDDLCQHIL